MKQELLDNVDLEQWYIILIKQFKKQVSSVLQNIQKNKYIITDVYKGKLLWIFAQKLFWHTKAAEMMSVYNQLIIVWNNLDLKFWVHMPEPQPTIIMSQFLKLLNSKTSLWSKITCKHHCVSVTALNSSYQSE